MAFSRTSTLLIVLLVFAWINQQVALSRELADLPAPGQLVEVDGHRMHLYCTGAGSPTVVIDAGNGDFSLSWRNVQVGLTQEMRVCTYDRAGYGWSEPSDQPRDAAHIVEELHALLTSEGSPPYLLVGHSLGGFHVQLYTLTYPEEIAGLVLVDNPLAISEFIDSPEYQSSLQQARGYYTVMQLGTSTGLLRLFGPLAGDRALPEVARAIPEVRDAYLTLVQNPSNWKTAMYELESVPQSAGHVRAGLTGDQPFGDLPLIVLSAGERPPALADLLREGHAWHAGLSSAGELRTITHSTHLMNLDAPEAIIQAVRDLR